MRTIDRVIGAVCLIVPSLVFADARAITGRFVGTGRSCSGTLNLSEKTISWLTPFSQCKPAPYQVIEQTNDGDRLRLTVQMNAKASSCLYSIVSLSHHGSAPDTGWEVTGYGKKESYEADKASGYQSRAQDMMSCYLVRDPARH
ncbi:MAG: hypothetical protein ACXWC4_14905 [Telluria sp.]